MLYTLYEGNRVTRVMVKVGEGNHNTMGALMNMLRHRPTPKASDKPFHAMYVGNRLVSSTY